MHTIIIGAGPSGLSAAYHLKKNHILIEKEKSVGGLGRSREIDFFIFDYAGHIFFSKDMYANNLFVDLLPDNHHFQERNSWVFSKKVYTRYPFQSNLFGLPQAVIDECIDGLKTALENKENSNPQNFDEWIEANFGVGISEHFMRPYNRKVWARPLSHLNFSWIEDRVKVPSLDDVIGGSKYSVADRYGPNSQFGYPLRGGCQSLMEAFLPHLNNTDLRLKTELWEIDINNRGITLSSGQTLGYDYLMSSIPLPELVRKIIDAPKEIIKMADLLRHTSVHCVNIGIDRERLTDKHWIYYPEEEFIFQRLFVQSNASPYVCPMGTTSLTAEISHSQHKPINPENIIGQVINDIIKTGLIDSEDEVLVTDHLNIEYGYIVFDQNRDACVEGIKKFIEEHNIIPIGRYGEWNYFNLDHAFLSGKAAAERINAGKL
jgi:UDP-galactopyranose mutase